MPQTLSTTFDAAGFDAFLQSRDEPDWLTDLRRTAFKHAEAMQWPDRRHEEWIRTDIRTFQLNKFGVPDGLPTETPMVCQLREDVDLAGSIETIDSQVVGERIDESLAEKGVVFGALERVCSERPEIVRPHLYTVFDADYDKFAAMHAAFWSGGQFLYVPKGVVLDRPLHIGSMMTDGGTDTTHTLVVLDEGAEATVLHESNGVTTDASGVHLGAVELIQKPGSHLRYVNLQEWGLKTFHFAPSKSQC